MTTEPAMLRWAHDGDIEPVALLSSVYNLLGGAIDDRRYEWVSLLGIPSVGYVLVAHDQPLLDGDEFDGLGDRYIALSRAHAGQFAIALATAVIDAGEEPVDQLYRR